jgi:hypothetical protein
MEAADRLRSVFGFVGRICCSVIHIDRIHFLPLDLMLHSKNIIF